MLIIGLILVTACYAASSLTVAAARDRLGDVAGLLAVSAAVGLAMVWWKWWQSFASTTKSRARRTAARELSAGLMAGTGLFAAVVGGAALTGTLRFTGVAASLGDFISVMAMALLSGTFEELLFRGVLLTQLARMTGMTAALFVTSMKFGAAHLLNPGATWFAALAIAIEAGVLLGAVFIYTGRLWAPIGLHAAWNFTQGWVFSLPVSGGRAPNGLVRTRLDGPDWLTGGHFGLEASVIAIAIAGSAGALVLWRMRQTKL